MYGAADQGYPIDLVLGHGRQVAVLSGTVPHVPVSLEQELRYLILDCAYKYIVQLIY